MKTPSHDLFHFIHSMTSSEKRYFKKDTKDSNTLDLFDIINEMEQYDEEIVKNRLSDVSYAGNLKVHKNRLQQILLKNLRSFYEEKTAQSKIKVLIENSEIFLKKQLYDLAVAQLDKAIQYCENYEEFELKLVALGIKARMSSYFTELHSFEETPIIEMDRCSKQIQNYIQHAIVNKKILHLFDLESSGTSISVIFPRVRQIIDSEIIDKNQLPISTIAERMYLHSQALMYQAKGDLAKACELSKQIVTGFESNTFIVEEKNAQYFNTIVNYLSFCCRLEGGQKEVELYAGKALKHASVYEQLMPNMIYIYSCYVESLRLGGQYAKLKALIESEVNELISKYRLSDTFLANKTLAMSVESYIACNDYDSAGIILRNLIAQKQCLPKDVQLSVYTLELIYHYDKGDFQFVDNLVNNHLKKVRRNNEHQKFFDALLSFFKKLANANLNEHKNLFLLYRSSLPLFEDDTVFYQLSNFINYGVWIDMHIRKQPYKLIAEERNRDKYN
jgi:hypothetical protein